MTIIEPIINLIELLILISVVYIFNFYYKYFTRPNPLPGPFPLPFIGNLLNQADINQFYKECQQKYGDICEVTLDHRYIILSRPDYIKKLFAPSEFFIHQPHSQGTEELKVHGQGLFFNGDFKSWNFNRQFFNEVLSLKFIDETIPSINQLFEEMSGYWESLGKQNSSNNENNNWTIETDLSAWFHGFTNEVTSMLTTGKRTYSIASCYNSQSITKSNHSDALVDNGSKFTKALVNLFESFLFFTFFPPFIRHYVPIFKDKTKSYLNTRDYLFNNLDDIIKSRRNEIERKQTTEIKTNMLTSLMTTKITVEGEKLRSMTDKEIRGNLLDIFLGGSDTTASLFCYITYYLCKNPTVKQKMLSEIDSIDSKFNKSSDLKKLKYCNAIIWEASRLMPPIAFTFRHITKEFEIAGYKWPAGTNFHLNFKGPHGHPELWNNPEVFNPDRFYDDDCDKSALMAFGGGKRICPGKNLAMNELPLFMALVYKNYNIELVNAHDPLKYASGMVISCLELKVRISPRT